MANETTKVKPLGMHPYLRAKLALDDLILAIINLLTRSGDLKKLALIQLGTIIDQVPGVDKQFPWLGNNTDVYERTKPVFEALRTMLANEVGADLAALEGVTEKVKALMKDEVEKKVKALLSDQAEPSIPESPAVGEGPETEDGEDDDGGETPPTVH
jgi:hypothetical protein